MSDDSYQVLDRAVAVVQAELGERFYLIPPPERTALIYAKLRELDRGRTLRLIPITGSGIGEASPQPSPPKAVRGFTL